MKKLLSILLCLIICLMFGCTKNQSSNGTTTSVPSVDVVTILDSSFVSQANDIYLNSNNYKDKVIIVQGIYMTSTVKDKVYHYVVRNTQTPEGENKIVGFEFKYSGEMPKTNDWIQVLGNVEPSTGADDKESIILNATRVDIMETRGQEFVSN